MHSAVETVSLEDLDHAADLLAHLAMDLRPDDDFTP
jgi:putative aminopeptidase FrvX